jgi:hypothetical protein
MRKSRNSAPIQSTTAGFGLLVRPTAHRSGLSAIAALSEFTPELGCGVASLFPALLQIFAVAVQLTCALNRHAFREAASADPATNCAPIKAEGVSNLCFRAAFPQVPKLHNHYERPRPGHESNQSTLPKLGHSLQRYSCGPR